MKYRYRNESEMKESGLDWIGKIPKDWSISRIKWLIEKKITDGPHETPEFIDEGIPFLSVDAIQDGKLIFDNSRYISHEDHIRYIKKCKPQRNDILMGKAASTGKIAMVDTDIEFSIWSPLALIKPSKEEIKSKYLEFSMKSSQAQHEIDLLCTSNTQKNISMDDIVKIKVIHPHLKEQADIASFLDEKTSHFDLIISQKEKLIKKLEEAKKSLISEVVTGKVKVVKIDDGHELVKRSRDEMKDSGVEWLGEIPKDWEVKKIKYLFQLRNERNFKEMKDVQLLSLFTSLGVMKQGEVEARGNKVRTVEDYKKVYPNDIVVNIILAWMGAIGMSEYKGVISPAYDIYKPINSDTVSKYYHYLFRTSRFSGECYKKGRGIMDMRWRTYSDEFKSIMVTSPDIEEKNNIVDCLDEKVNNIDSLIEKTKKQISRLKEAKQSLISEAVTGKIEILD